jgi:hypothetical protein
LNGRHPTKKSDRASIPKIAAMLAAFVCLSPAGTGWAGASGRDSVPAPASIVIVSVDVTPDEMNDVAPNSVATFKINVVLHNDGESNGTVQLSITGMNGVVASENITLGGFGTIARTYDWKLQGDRRHTSVVSISGNVGNLSNMPAAADLHYKASAPGFGALLMLGAMAATAGAIRQRRICGHVRRPGP